MLKNVMENSDDELDWLMLRNADNPRKIFSISGQLPLTDPKFIEVFNRGVDSDWFTLVDVSIGGRMFKLTPAGIARLDFLREGRE